MDNIDLDSDDISYVTYNIEGTAVEVLTRQMGTPDQASRLLERKAAVVQTKPPRG